MKLEKMQEIFQTVLVENINNSCGGNIEDIFDYLAELGFSKKEAFDFIEKNYLAGVRWRNEGEEETEAEDVSVGDSDQAILETALTQIGIPYTWGENPEGGCIFVEEVEDGKTTGKTVAEIYFTKDGDFNGLC